MGNAMDLFETTEVVGMFLNECFVFWLRAGKTRDEAIEFAIKDVDGITTDPFSPAGRQLDEEATRITVDVWRNKMRSDKNNGRV